MNLVPEFFLCIHPSCFEDAPVGRLGTRTEKLHSDSEKEFIKLTSENLSNVKLKFSLVLQTQDLRVKSKQGLRNS